MPKTDHTSLKDKPQIFEESLEEILKPRDFSRRDKDGNIFNIKVTTITGPQAAALISALRTGSGLDYRDDSVDGMPILDVYMEDNGFW